MKYFYDAKVGKIAHLWRVHDTYCRFRLTDSTGQRELHHEKGSREVCHKCAGKWLASNAQTSVTAQRYLQSQPSTTL